MLDTPVMKNFSETASNAGLRGIKLVGLLLKALSQDTLEMQ